MPGVQVVLPDAKLPGGDRDTIVWLDAAYGADTGARRWHMSAVQQMLRPHRLACQGTHSPGPRCLCLPLLL